MTGIEARGLSRTFAGRPPVQALRSVDLTVPDGGITAVLGPSGCGKTTFLRTVAGLERLDDGVITMAGRVLAGPGTHVPPERRRIGLVPQEGALFPHLDVARNIGFGLHRSTAAVRRARVGELLELVGMAGMGSRRPSELSGGQQQRVALARALAPAPGLVLLDEPFSALDTGLRASLRDEVAATLRATGATGVLVTHDQAEALSMADRVAVMRDGRVVQEGTSAEVYRTPTDLWAARFLGDAVVLAGQRGGGDPGSVDTLLGRLPLAPGHEHAPGPEVAVFLRPEQLRPSPDPSVGVKALLERVRFQGHDAAVWLRIGDVVVSARWPSLDLPEPGSLVTLTVSGTAIAFPPG